MADLHGDRVSHLLVDARPVDHPTARNRGIGRYTIGLLSGLQQVGAPVVAVATPSCGPVVPVARLMAR